MDPGELPGGAEPGLVEVDDLAGDQVPGDRGQRGREEARGLLRGRGERAGQLLRRDIEQRIPDTSAKVVLYCGGGFRSALAADNLQKMGYSNVESMDGGWKGWKDAGYPTQKD